MRLGQIEKSILRAIIENGKVKPADYRKSEKYEYEPEIYRDELPRLIFGWDGKKLRSFPRSYYEYPHIPRPQYLSGQATLTRALQSLFRSGYQLMRSAEFMQLLEKNPVEKVNKKGEIVYLSKPILPKNEGQCRPLINKLEHNGERIKVWAEVVRTGEKINAELVQTKVDEFLESGEVVPDIEYIVNPSL